MSDSSTSGSYTHATSVSADIPGLRPLRIPDHYIPRHDPSQSSDQPPETPNPIVSPPDRPSNLPGDHSTDTNEFLYGPSSPVPSDSDRELRSFFASHFSRQEETEGKFAIEVTSNLVGMNTKLDALLDAVNGSFSRQEGILTAILAALQTGTPSLSAPSV